MSIIKTETQPITAEKISESYPSPKIEASLEKEEKVKHTHTHIFIDKDDGLVITVKSDKDTCDWPKMIDFIIENQDKAKEPEADK